MKLLIEDEIIDFANKENNVKLIMEKIEQFNNNGNLALSYLIIDGVEVYDQFEDYIIEHLTTIEIVQTIVKPIRDLVNDLFLSAEEYLIRAIPELKSLIDEFYQGPIKTTWDKFNELLIGLQWIHQLISTVDHGKYQPRNWNKYLNSINTVQDQLENLENAIVTNDYILVGDILLHEVLPELDTLKNELGISIDHEGKRNHVN